MKFSGKIVLAAFCTSASSGIGNSDDRLMELAGEDTDWLEGKRFPAGTAKDEIEAWLVEIGLTE